MKVIGILAAKGGVGKTTLTIHLSMLAKTSRVKVAVIDTDYPQGSLTRVLSTQERAEELAILDHQVNKLEQTLEKARSEKFDYVFIDGTPNTAHSFKHYAPYCDLIVSPMMTSLEDREAMIDAIEAIPLSARDRQYFVLNRVRPRRGKRENPKTEAVLEYLTSANVQVAPLTLGNYVDYEDAFEVGQTVTHYNPKGAASKEIQAFWTWIKKAL